jgi:hypothetical protein
VVHSCLETIAAGRRELFRLWLLACLLAVSGCANPATVPPRPATATLGVVNGTDYAWCVTLTPVAGGVSRREELPARARCSVEVVGGDYAIEQEVVPTNPALARRFTCRLEAGQAYHWRLATLLSDDTGSRP